MKYALTILLFFASFLAQAEGSNKQGGFFSLDFGVAVDNKLSKIHYPVFLSYGGSILDDQYIGQVEIGVGVYDLPFHLLFKYNYDFMHHSSNWSAGVDTALYLGGHTIQYTVKDGKVVDDVGKNFTLFNVKSDDEIDGINIYVGHDLGVFLKKHISKSFAVLFRGGVNNVLSIKPRFTTSQSPQSSDAQSEKNEDIKITREFLNPNFYLSTGIEWYL